MLLRHPLESGDGVARQSVRHRECRSCRERYYALQRSCKTSIPWAEPIAHVSDDLARASAIPGALRERLAREQRDPVPDTQPYPPAPQLWSSVHLNEGAASDLVVRQRVRRAWMDTGHSPLVAVCVPSISSGRQSGPCRIIWNACDRVQGWPLYEVYSSGTSRVAFISRNAAAAMVPVFVW